MEAELPAAAVLTVTVLSASGLTETAAAVVSIVRGFIPPSFPVGDPPHTGRATLQLILQQRLFGSASVRETQV
jgi:hypothetical protein